MSNTGKNNLKTVLSNLKFIFGAEFFIRLMMLLMTIWIARHYAKEYFGVYTLALSVGNLFEIFFNLGLYTVFIQRISANTEIIENELGKFLSLKIFLSIISFLFLLIFAVALNKNESTFYAIVLSGAYYGLFSILTFLWGCFDGTQKMKYNALNKFIKFTVIFILSATFIVLNYPIQYILLAYLVAAALSIAISSYFIEKKICKISIKIDWNDWIEIIKKGWPITLASTFVFVYNYLDTIIISITKGESAVGLYQVSYKIIGTIFIISQLISQVYLPSWIVAKKNNSVELQILFNKAMDTVFFWSLPITLGGLILSDKIILNIFGIEYLGAINSFRILIWNCIIFFISYTLTSVLFAFGKQKKIVFAFFIGALVNTTANIFIIPIFGIEGAAATTVLAEFAVLFCIYFEAKKVVQIKILHSIWQSLIASSIMAIILTLQKNDSLIIQLTIGCLSYFGTYFIVRKIFSKINSQKKENMITDPLQNNY